MMAAEADFTYNQGFVFPDSDQLDHIFLNSDQAEISTWNPDRLVQSSNHKQRAFPNAFVDNALHAWDENGNLSCSSAQDNLFSFDGFGLPGNGDSTCLDSCDEAFGTSLDLLPGSQADNQSLDPVLGSQAVEWLMPWEEGLTDIASSQGIPISPGNSYQPTPDLIECSTPISVSTSNGFRDAIVEAVGSFDTENQRWHATLSRFRAADRHFLYGVLTTKIFCRPSCASRRPSRRHVRFFCFPGAIEAAEQAKFRPCKRCNPQTLGVVNTCVLAISQILRRIIAETFGQRTEATKEGLKLGSLAKSAGLSVFHFHRLFKATTQVTPAEFITACHVLTIQDALCKCSTRGPGSDPNAVNSPPRCSERTARKALGGLSPEEYANGANRTLIEYCCVSSPVGEFEVASSKGEEDTNMNVHAVVRLQDSGSRICDLFQTAKRSGDHTQRLQKCIRELEDKCQDRDVELAADVLPVLWRARLWLALTHDGLA